MRISDWSSDVCSSDLRQLEDGIARGEAVLPRLCRLAQGGTAVGTGLNAPPGFAEDFAAEAATATGLPFATAPNKFEALATHDTMVELSGALNVLAVKLGRASCRERVCQYV